MGSILPESSVYSHHVGSQPDHASRLDILKALGDNTRYAVYLELARSARPKSTAEVAENLDLHPNSVRPHLERMREAGLVDYETHSQGVGRPVHKYFLADDAPALGLEPPTFPLLAALLAQTARNAAVDREDVVAVGCEHGKGEAARFDDGEDRLARLLVRQDELGFDPVLHADDDGVVVAFGHCPFGAVAAQYPDLVCAIHEGLVEGLVDDDPDLVVEEFSDGAAREPCRVALSRR